LTGLGGADLYAHLAAGEVHVHAEISEREELDRMMVALVSVAEAAPS
jgi:hypothetical protein